MTLTTPALLLAAVVLAGTAAAAATTDDVKWINQCVQDNKGDAKADVILKYCTCMNNKMDDDETKSVTEWAISHPDEKAVCETKAGLNARAPVPAPAPAPVPAPAPASAPGATSGSGN